MFRLSLHCSAGLPCIFLAYGLQVVTREVHRSSLRLMCPAQDHFILFDTADYKCLRLLPSKKCDLFLSIDLVLLTHTDTQTCHCWWLLFAEHLTLWGPSHKFRKLNKRAVLLSVLFSLSPENMV